MRISSNPRIISEAVSPRQAAEVLARIVALPGHLFWACDAPVAGIDPFRRDTLVGHRQVTDAYLLETARRNDGQLVTLDRGVVELLSGTDERARWIELVAQ